MCVATFQLINITLLPNSRLFLWLALSFIILFELQLIFMVYPINIGKIRKYIDPSYELSKNSNTNQSQETKGDKVTPTTQTASTTPGGGDVSININIDA
ncbi:hypothetical protein CYY_000786 [Polysphondylium violaceum]|uniref:Transmembrane protein n=1 Tax=Polysphondylium violaceum TaxID=133409 RepID=A0A8J4V590_9MYCE|nr:hypothetical protein CYY_000786 [Polysphondylium violaceum]